MLTWLSCSSMSMTSTRRAGVCITRGPGRVGICPWARVAPHSTSNATCVYHLMERTVARFVLAGRGRFRYRDRRPRWRFLRWPLRRRRADDFQRAPTRIAVTLRAVQWGRDMIRDLAGGGDAVVAALTVCEQPGVVEARRAPRQRGVAVVATHYGRHMMQGLRGRAHAVMTATALFPL